MKQLEATVAILLVTLVGYLSLVLLPHKPYIAYAQGSMIATTELVMPTSTPVDQSTSPVVPSIVTTPSPNSALTLAEQITALSKEIDALREQQYQQIAARASSASESASLIIQWSGFFLTAFAVIVGVAGFFGFREYQNIRSQYDAAEKLRKQFLEDTQSIQELTHRVEKQLEELSSIKLLAKRLERESQTSLEASYHFNLATGAYRHGNYKTAIEHFRIAAKLQPLNMHILCRLGRAYTEQESVPDAVRSFNEALRLDPNNTEALRGLATTYRYIDLNLAIQYAKRATDADSTDNEAFDYLGLLYRDSMRIEEAIQAHEQALKIRPRPMTYYLLSLLYAHKHDHEHARLMILSASVELEREEKELVPERNRPLWAISIRCSKLMIEGNYDEALKLAETLRQYLTTPRPTKAVLEQFEFLLKALQREDIEERLIKIFQVDRQSTATS